VVFPNVYEAERRVDYLYVTLESLRRVAADASPGSEPDALRAQAKILAAAQDAVLAALDKDINTPQALAVVSDLAKAGNEIATFATKKKDPAARALAKAAEEALRASCDVLGLLQSPIETFFARTREQRLRIRGLDTNDIEEKVKARERARATKDFALADALRADLTKLGVELSDGDAGTAWRLPM
jgi:cysteinyl-tRNA synthetase